VRSIAWQFVHRPDAVYVARSPATAPRYRFVASVPEGPYDAERREAMVSAITEAVPDAEQGAYERDPARVPVFTPEVPDGTWGALGRIVTLADIARSPRATRTAAAAMPRNGSVDGVVPRRSPDALAPCRGVV
jgi:hypothetical protein